MAKKRTKKRKKIVKINCTLAGHNLSKSKSKKKKSASAKRLGGSTCNRYAFKKGHKKIRRGAKRKASKR